MRVQILSQVVNNIPSIRYRESLSNLSICKFAALPIHNGTGIGVVEAHRVLAKQMDK